MVYQLWRAQVAQVFARTILCTAKGAVDREEKVVQLARRGCNKKVTTLADITSVSIKALKMKTIDKHYYCLMQLL